MTSFFFTHDFWSVPYLRVNPLRDAGFARLGAAIVHSAEGRHEDGNPRPAIAAPVTQVRARAVVEDARMVGVRLRAPDLKRDYPLSRAGKNDPFARAVRTVFKAAGITGGPNLTVTVRSSIPIASGLGSGAAMAAAVIRALALHLARPDLAADEQVSALTYEVERLLHGTPSGIDNTVVSFEQPVFFRRREPENHIVTLTVAAPLHILVADTGAVSATKVVVGDVRRRWEADKPHFERLFDDCGQIARMAREAIEKGEIGRLGQLMDDNQAVLEELTVSSPDLEKLIGSARAAGALGAKLSGAGRGGNMIALVDEPGEPAVVQALKEGGARTVLASTVS